MKYVNESITEFDRNKLLVQFFPKDRLQLNCVNESDAELITLPQQQRIMAITTDILCEEIEYGIYTNPYLTGWIAVSVNVSDLCAVGATPSYILLNEIFPSDVNENFVNEVQKGIADACKAFNIFVAGGDTNYISNKFLLGGTAFGFIESSEKCVKRIGCKPGDILFSSGYLGMGNFYGFTKLNDIKIDFEFKPQLDIRYAEILGKYASSCIDTSDGMFHALDVITRLNNIGVHLKEGIDKVIPSQLIKTCKMFGIPYISLLAGVLGEYELLFTIPKEKIKGFVKEANDKGLNPYELGHITPENSVILKMPNEVLNIDIKKIVSLFSSNQGNLPNYVQSLIGMFK